MKRGVAELSYMDGDIGSNLPKKPQKDTDARARDELRADDAYASPQLATVAEGHSERLTPRRHTRDELRSQRRRCPGLNGLYHLECLEPPSRTA